MQYESYFVQQIFLQKWSIQRGRVNNFESSSFHLYFQRVWIASNCSTSTRHQTFYHTLTKKWNKFGTETNFESVNNFEWIKFRPTLTEEKLWQGKYLRINQLQPGDQLQSVLRQLLNKFEWIKLGRENNFDRRTYFEWAQHHDNVD